MSTKKNRITLMRLLAMLACLLLMGTIGFSQDIKVEKKDGHVSPLKAKITFPSGNTRNVTVKGIGPRDADEFYTHVFKGVGEGDSRVTLYIDSIRVIKEPTDDDALFVMRDGTERRLSFINEYDFGGPPLRLRYLIVANPDGGGEKIDITKIKSVEFSLPEK